MSARCAACGGDRAGGYRGCQCPGGFKSGHLPAPDVLERLEQFLGDDAERPLDLVEELAFDARAEIATLREELEAAERERDELRERISYKMEVWAGWVRDHNVARAEKAEDDRDVLREALETAWPLLVAMSAWKDDCGYRLLRVSAESAQPARTVARRARKLARAALDRSGKEGA